MIPIYIPTRGRVDHVPTFEALKGVGRPVRLVAAAEETPAYADVYGAENVLTLTNFSHRLGHKREAIAEHAMAYGHEWFWMMDDDLSFFRRESDESTKLIDINSDPWELEQMLVMAENLPVEVDMDRVGLIGISARGGNNRRKIPYEVNCRLLRCYLVNTQAFLSVQHDRVPFMEDFDFMLQLLRKGYDLVDVTDYAQEHKGTNAAGGYTPLRDGEGQSQAARILYGLHTQFVSIVQKENSAFGKHFDVRVQWKKARASADV